MKVMFAAFGSEIVSIEAISAVLRKHGHDCKLAFDRGMFNDKQYFEIPLLARLFDDSRRVVDDIAAYSPDLLAFSVCADTYQWSLAIASRVKAVRPIPVIFGGAHPTSVPDLCIAEPCVDIVCVGEGEYPMLDLLQSMRRGSMDYSIPNLWFKKDGGLIRNAPRPLIDDLDSLPVIDKEIFEDFIPLSKYYLTVTNKGCISRCSYCSQNFYFRWEQERSLGTFYRERSVASVLGELAEMKRRYRMRRIDIKNNVLSASRAWTLEFARRYKEEICLPFRIMGHPKTIDAEIAVALKDAGCWHVQLGVESLNPTVRRDVLYRNESNGEIFAAVNAMEAAGLGYSIDIMVGLPGERDQDVEEALSGFACRRHLVRASIFWLAYLPGVDITRYACDRGLIDKGDVDTINAGRRPNYLSTGSITDRRRRECLLNYQILFRALPVLPRWVLTAVLRKKLFRFFRYVPQIPVIIAIDVVVSFVKKDHWATYAIYSYFWEIGRRIRRMLAKDKS